MWRLELFKLKEGRNKGVSTHGPYRPKYREKTKTLLILSFLFICFEGMQVQCTTKSRHQAMESRRVEAVVEEEESAVQRGGLPARTLNHS